MAQWLGAYPAPAGEVVNLIDPPDQRQGNTALHATCLTLVTISVAIRFYTRIYITKAVVGIEDCMFIPDNEYRPTHAVDRPLPILLRQWTISYTNHTNADAQKTQCLTVTFSAFMLKGSSVLSLKSIFITDSHEPPAYSFGIGRHIWNEPAQWLVPALKV